MAEDAPKPITTDADEAELLKEMDIPLVKPADPEDVAPAEPTEPAPEEKTDEPTEPVESEETAPEEKAADPAEVPTDEGGEPAADRGTDAPTDVRDEVPPATAAVMPPAQAAQAPAAQPTALQQQLEAIEAKIMADDFDPYSKDGKQLQLQHNRLAGMVAAEPLYAARAEQSAWQHYTADPQYAGIAQAKMEEVFKKHLAVYEKRGFKGDLIGAAATVAMEFELQQIANGLKGQRARTTTAPAPSTPNRPAPQAKTPITPTGARVAPPSAKHVPPQPKAKSDEEELLENVRKVPGGLKSLIG